MKPTTIKIGRFVQKNLLWFLVTAYIVGAIWPYAGLWVRGMPGTGNSTGWLLKGLLGLLLFNAGLGLDPQELGRLSARRAVLVTALVTSVVVPASYVLFLTLVVCMIGEPGTMPQLVLGLAVVAAMPVAGSSTAWSQNAEANLALSLGLLLASTLVSPLAALVILNAVTAAMGSTMLPGFTSMPSNVAVVFLTLWVALPVAAGIMLRWLIGGARIERAKPYLKLVNLADLLVLNYANAALALPSVVHHPDPASLAFIVAMALGLALLAFASAHPIARFFRLEASQRTSQLDDA